MSRKSTFLDCTGKTLMLSHDLYKWAQDRPRRPTRAASFSHPEDRPHLAPEFANIKEPGGFRRNFVVNRALEQGEEPPTMVRNVVDFLYLYGHFVSSASTPFRA
jgi:proton-coupled amino acid transporter